MTFPVKLDRALLLRLGGSDPLVKRGLKLGERRYGFRPEPAARYGAKVEWKFHEPGHSSLAGLKAVLDRSCQEMLVCYA
jgi:hypothetical protein